MKLTSSIIKKPLPGEGLKIIFVYLSYYIGQGVPRKGLRCINYSCMRMKINTLAAIVCIVLLSISDGFAQHSLQVDDGNGHYTTLLGGNPGGTLTLPSGNGILLLSYSGTSSVAWLTGGNSGTTPASNPLTFSLTTNSFLGTADNTELDFVTNGAVRARFKESTGDTNTSGAFEPGIGNTYSLGTLDRPWNHLYVSGATITFTNSTGVHGTRDGGQSAAAVSIGNLSFDSASSTFNFDHPLKFCSRWNCDNNKCDNYRSYFAKRRTDKSRSKWNSRFG